MILEARYEKLVTSIEKRLFIPWILSSGCCSVEIENTGLATYDWQRLGIENVAADPSDANLLIVAGWINSNRAEQLRDAFDRMRKPTSVIAFGVCALSGSPYTMAQSSVPVIKASDLVPVDVNVAGCPPRPEALLSAILELRRKLSPGPSAREVLSHALR